MPGFRDADPKQSFPELEQRVLERWREGDTFARQVSQREGAPLWSFYEGPPTANGQPGSHHVLSRVFKDVYPRYHAMTGERVPRKGGWDCHGLPVELEIEKELGISSKAEIEEYGIAEFNAKCRESVFRYVEDWKRLTERIGFWIDMDDPYVTMEDDYIESVWWALRRIWDDGRLYEGHKVVPYCPRCGTALSSHEVAQGYHEVEDPSVFVKLPVGEPVPNDEIPQSPLQPGDQLLVWTTTPWTLISNAAVAAGAEIEYVRARSGDEVLVLASDLAEEVLGEDAEILAHFPGEALAGTPYEPPFDYATDFGPRGHTVLMGDFVTTDEGTGLVHTAVAFGEDDFRLGEQYGLTLQNPVKLDGTFDERVTDFAGRSVKEADADIVKALEADGRLLLAQSYLHSYPHCWRCDTPLLYYAKASWYVATSQVKDRMLAANEGIGWHPEHIKHGRFGKWLESNVDWALSRDRYWGTPLPIWECDAEGCEQRFCAGSRQDLRERGGEVPDDLHRPYIDEVVLDCDREGCDGRMRRVPAVIDTWFDSGSMPWAQFHYPFENTELFEERFPADYICEAIDQTRGWFYTLLAESTLLFDDTSFRNCVSLGLILDLEGQKMSKSRGNVVDPREVIDEHGADAFRWYYLTSQQPWAGYRFDSGTVGESVRQFLLTLWNTYSFWALYANLATPEMDPEAIYDEPKVELGPEDFAPGATLRVSEAFEQMPHSDELDSWALSRLQGTIAVVRGHMDEFDCTAAGREISEFVDELSNWYVRLGRRRFWQGDMFALATLRTCLVEVSKLLAPFTPFVAEEIYSNLVGGADESFFDQPDSVHLCDMPEADPDLVDTDLESTMEVVRRTVELGRAARAHGKVKMRQPLRRAVIVASPAEREGIEQLAGLVTSELNVKELEFVEERSALVSYRAKADYRKLGPRFGKDMPLVAAAVEALDADALTRVLDGGGEVGISIDGHDHTLAADEVSLVMEPLEGYQVESEAGHAVGLALEIDEDLQTEGWAREIVHAVQGARKSAGLEVSDRIALTLSGDPELLEAAREHQQYVGEETLALSVDYGADGAGEPARIEGRELRISLERADEEMEFGLEDFE
ncbi:MAG: isoleucine--tRNA ligase [Actinobacteria bacterium]|nr:isoleucine--tRNA ligase [Actinomycetota bacterium]